MDETGFTLETGENIIGVGMLLTEAPIENDLTSEAMMELKKEIKASDETDERDHRTIENGFFHASEDSKNAHSYICTSIRKHINGNFNFFYLKPSDDDTRKKEELNRLILGLATMPHDQRREDFELTYENRNKFGINAAKSWLKDHQNKQFLRMIQDGFPTSFPNIKLVEGDKSIPGLQVVDFILWAINRRIKNSGNPLDENWFEKPALDDWYNRLEIELMDTSAVNGNYMVEGTIAIGDPLDFNYIFYPKVSAMKIDPIYAYLNIERYLRYFDRKGLPKHASNHSKPLKVLIKRLDGKIIGKKILREVCTLFLKLFDTIPIYGDLKETDVDEWAILIALKNLAMFWLNTRSADSVWQINHILHWRKDYFIDKPEIFRRYPFSCYDAGLFVEKGV
ncbi:DUF3800 domain-containing protein [Methanobacterium subterraneum]|uniref:DUF3800 domain-containing protein n=1 Tax=Methanobacterium subterraneum TaxID=59277 RepID=A0A7K4DMB9_9EURY|nr:DUF3800 domain-containing protein [Methanobacterium subterraneum]